MFGEKFAIQFHELNVKAKITSKFAKRRSQITKFVRRKKLLILRGQKIQEKMMVKLTPGVVKVQLSSIEQYEPCKLYTIHSRQAHNYFCNC